MVTTPAVPEYVSVPISPKASFEPLHAIGAGTDSLTVFLCATPLLGQLWIGLEVVLLY